MRVKVRERRPTRHSSHTSKSHNADVRDMSVPAYLECASCSGHLADYPLPAVALFFRHVGAICFGPAENVFARVATAGIAVGSRRSCLCRDRPADSLLSSTGSASFPGIRRPRLWVVVDNARSDSRSLRDERRDGSCQLAERGECEFTPRFASVNKVNTLLHAFFDL